MTHEPLTNSLTILGRELRTSNDEAFQTIPPFWGTFYGAGVIEQIPDRLSDDVYAVYTNFEHEGVDNLGMYSLVIGCLVDESTTGTDKLIAVSIPESKRTVFPVETGRPDLVGATWQEIWSRSDLAQTYIADFEHYAPDGTISISIGVARYR